MPKAKFADIYQDLKQKVEQGMYAYQSLIPSENVLSEAYGCSRNTVRRALRGLIERGYAQAIQGKGVRVLYQRRTKANSASAGLRRSRRPLPAIICM